MAAARATWRDFKTVNMPTATVDEIMNTYIEAGGSGWRRHLPRRLEAFAPLNRARPKTWGQLAEVAPASPDIPAAHRRVDEEIALRPAKSTRAIASRRAHR